MTHVITQTCCNDATCVPACPVNCIHPTPDEPDYATAEMLYIDPDGCIDCGACIDVCPVNAIYPDYELPDHLAPFTDLNSAYFEAPQRRDYEPVHPPRHTPTVPPSDEPLRVAVVGSGPAGLYAAEELLGIRSAGIKVDVIEKLPVPGGLVRYGVAPDHQSTKTVWNQLARTMGKPGFRLLANVEVGRDINHEDLATRYHAVVYANGADADKCLGIPGEDMPGSHSAGELVGWYNGHPDFAELRFDFSNERVVVLGNGNVAVDIARVLLSSVDDLRRTDISATALAQIAESQVREVVIVGRRGVAEAAFTTAELLGLARVEGLSISSEVDELSAEGSLSDVVASRFTTAPQKNRLLHELSARATSDSKMVSFRFLHSPIEIVGNDRVAGVRLARNEMVREGTAVVARPTGDVEEIKCGMVVRSLGFQGRPIGSLPFDAQRSVLPTREGRVLSSGGDPIAGVYAAGWIKRGPSGVIGTNKACAIETVRALLDDYAAAKLTPPAVGGDLLDLVSPAVDVAGWRAIDSRERSTGKAEGRPRTKMTSVTSMLEAASIHHRS
ncbi:FAD-dependent oxidoreductase [Nocardioides sp. WS12]|uniref:FAD-dependent oxidoreductase n=1 Tax=Nocardioides sp. WS12 TaxID=2486272 RepID=UPI0015FD7246|nr:FAD-dependent oxidoreductase [Nocardioides sp. WS12]